MKQKLPPNKSSPSPLPELIVTTSFSFFGTIEYFESKISDDFSALKTLQIWHMYNKVEILVFSEISSFLLLYEKSNICV